jgi:hypothetical protein
VTLATFLICFDTVQTLAILLFQSRAPSLSPTTAVKIVKKQVSNKKSVVVDSWSLLAIY